MPVREGDERLHCDNISFLLNNPATFIKIGKDGPITSLEDKEVHCVRPRDVTTRRPFPRYEITKSHDFDQSDSEGERPTYKVSHSLRSCVVASSDV